ncbi:hypothetical protein VOLCADRAFT_86926 [Volvox carteri f. nagariensis]|uniref:EamA domain-containing protein n=1 Tax=Volvox carteri f. nagariensis TaxID=3068 RepID=D8TKQ7_VOLCA|nr:uncharacterized protein VOLCADRAFT_86926 [Volvox carteri f. nagariensis]EFJ52106.1 hypothetical protein VOLCADRAFT_86926 [Volvox carteri f. nagariensis]|eukprot:XP_002946880.1 hypothetical protein VOLCADRAFT_86926 [Volvox carteri f. nagariensis]
MLLPGRGTRLRSQLVGALILLTTTILWASGGPTTKYLFLLPTPPSAALLTACVSVITALFLGVGLLGTLMETSSRSSSGSRRTQAAAASSYGDSSSNTAAAGSASPEAIAAAAAAAAASRRSSAAGIAQEEEAEAEALLHSGMHNTGAAGGALAAACAAAREAAQELDYYRGLGREEREHYMWARSQECALPLLTSHGSYYHSARGSSYIRTAEAGDPECAAKGGPLSDGGSPTGAPLSPGGGGRKAVAPAPAMGMVGLSHRQLSEAPALEAGRSGRDGGDGGDGGGRGVGLCEQVHARRGPSLDGVVGSPPPPLRPSYAVSGDLGWLSGGGGGASGRGSGGGGLDSRPRSGGGGAAGRWRLRLLTVPAHSLPAAGLELGIYNVTAAALGAWGMQRISATRSAFLTQATSLLTPLLVWLSGGLVSMTVWIACCCGAMGGAMVALDNVYGSTAAAAAANGARHARQLLGSVSSAAGNSFDLASGDDRRTLLSASGAPVAAATSAAAAGAQWQVEGLWLTRQSMGAVYVLLSCVFWGMGTVRLGVHSARYPPLHLAAAAAVSYAGLSLLWLLWEVLGQQTVPPAQAQVLFSSTPLWSALLAQLLLPGEAMGPLAWLGGAVMLGASLLASLWQ